MEMHATMARMASFTKTSAPRWVFSTAANVSGTSSFAMRSRLLSVCATLRSAQQTSVQMPMLVECFCRIMTMFSIAPAEPSRSRFASWFNAR